MAFSAPRRRSRRPYAATTGHRQGRVRGGLFLFSPTYRQLEGRRAWISSERTYGITAPIINYLDVTYADGIATSTVDVTFQDDTGAPRFLVTWILTKQDGVWKLDRQTSSERL